MRQQIAELKAGLTDPKGKWGMDLAIPQVGGNARKTNHDCMCPRARPPSLSLACSLALPPSLSLARALSRALSPSLSRSLSLSLSPPLSLFARPHSSRCANTQTRTATCRS